MLRWSKYDHIPFLWFIPVNMRIWCVWFSFPHSKQIFELPTHQNYKSICVFFKMHITFLSINVRKFFISLYALLHKSRKRACFCNLFIDSFNAFGGMCFSACAISECTKNMKNTNFFAAFWDLNNHALYNLRLACFGFAKSVAFICTSEKVVWKRSCAPATLFVRKKCQNRKQIIGRSHRHKAIGNQILRYQWLAPRRLEKQLA